MGSTFASSGLRACAVVAVLAIACTKDVKGPEPTLEEPSIDASPPPVFPEIVCRDQLTTEVTVTGHGFSPVPIDIPDAPKAALPTITLTRSHELDGGEVGDPDAVVYSGDYDKDATNATDEDGALILVDGEPLLKWTSQTEMSFLVTQQLVLGAAPAKGETDDRVTGMLPEGVWDVTVANANGSGTQSLQTLAVVDKPQVSALTEDSPGIVCVAQGARTLSLEGSTFLRNEGETVELDVEGVADPFTIDLSQCTAIEHGGLDAEVCEAASIELAMDSIEPGWPALTVRNPATAQCVSTDDIKLRVVPPPRIDRVDPPLGCVTEEARPFTLHGMDFLRVDGSDPNVSIGGMDFVVDSMGGCEALETQGNVVERCESVTFTVAMGRLGPELYDVTVTNPDPAGCDDTATASLRIVPPPSIADVQPPLICVDDSERDVVVSGSDFLIVDGAIPVVEVDGGALDPSAVDVSGCSDLAVDGLTVQRCDTMTVTIAQGGVGLGMPVVSVTNPAPAGCSDERGDLLTVVEGPVIESAEPALLCTIDGGRAIQITGTGFLSVGTTLPAVMVEGSAVASVDSVGGCSDVTVNGLDVQQCTTLNVTVAQGALTDDGRPEVAVVNPDPAGCMATNAEVLTVPPALGVVSVSPRNVCQNSTDAAFAFTVSGTGFLRVDAADFSFRVSGTDVAPTAIADCTDLTVAGVSSAQSCNTIDATIDLTGLAATLGATIPIEVQNDNVLACDLTAMTALTVVAPPTIDMTCGAGGTGPCIDILANATDSDVCSDVAFSVVITGSNFVDGATVRFEQDSTDTGTEVVVASTVTVNSDTELQADFETGLEYDASDPTWDLIVESAGNCASPALVDLVTVNPSPLVFFVDPPVVYNDISIDVTVFTANLSASSLLDTIELVDSGGTATELVVVDNPKFNRIVANVPGAATFAPGDYDVRVTSTLQCSGTLEGGVTVTDTLNGTLLTGIAPSFVSPTDPTAVTVSGSGMLVLPRLYLTPSSGVGTATALRAVELNVAGDEATAIVPGGLASGQYDLVLVNPNGEVDVLPMGVTVTTAEPPIIVNVVPASVTPTGAASFTIEGIGFEDNPTVGLECDSGAMLVASSAVISGGAAAAGSITAIAGASLVDGESFVLGDGVNPAVTFELDNDASVVESDTLRALVFAGTETADEVRDLIIAAVTAAPTLDIAASDGGAALVNLTNDATGALANVGITETVVDAGFVVAGMSGGSAGTSVDVSVNTSSLSGGDVCLVRLTNTDGSFFVYSALSITNPSLNLSAWTVGTTMTTPRRALALEAGRPTNTSRFLYAIGGDDGVASAPRSIGPTVYDSVEAARVDLFGNMQAWSAQRNSLPAARTWAGSARIGRFIYLVGGHDDAGGADAATDTLYRAEILDPLATPDVGDLDAVLGNPDAGIGLPGGLYYYRVAAVFPASDPSNPDGESLAGEALPVQLPDRPEGIVLSLRWEEIRGASGYRIYRSPAAGDAVDQVELLAEVTCGDPGCDCTPDGNGLLDTCPLDDDGTLATTAETPMPRGSLGVWHAVDGGRCADADCLLTTPREAMAAFAIQEPTDADTFYLYAVGGRDDVAGYLRSYEMAVVSIDPATGDQVVTDWTEVADHLNTARAELGAWVMSRENSAVIRNSGTPTDVWVYLGGGRTTGGGFDNNVDAAPLGASGALGALVSTDNFSRSLAGFGAGAANDRLYTFGGQTGPDGGSAELCGQPTSPGGCGPLPDLEPGSWNSLAAATVDRISMGAVQESAFFYLCGGHDGLMTLDTTQQTVQ